MDVARSLPAGAPQHGQLSGLPHHLRGKRAAVDAGEGQRCGAIRPPELSGGRPLPGSHAAAWRRGRSGCVGDPKGRNFGPASPHCAEAPALPLIDPAVDDAPCDMIRRDAVTWESMLELHTAYVDCLHMCTPTALSRKRPASAPTYLSLRRGSVCRCACRGADGAHHQRDPPRSHLSSAAPSLCRRMPCPSTLRSGPSGPMSWALGSSEDISRSTMQQIGLALGDGVFGLPTAASWADSAWLGALAQGQHTMTSGSRTHVCGRGRCEWRQI